MDKVTVNLRNVVAIFMKVLSNSKTLYSNLNAKGKLLVFLPFIITVGMLVFSPIAVRINTIVHIRKEDTSNSRFESIISDKINIYNIVMLGVCWVFNNFYTITHQFNLGIVVNWQVSACQIALVWLKIHRCTLNIDFFFIMYIIILLCLNIAANSYSKENNFPINPPFQISFEHVQITEESFLLYVSVLYSLSIILLNFISLPHFFIAFIMKTIIIGSVVLSFIINVLSVFAIVPFKVNKYNIQLLTIGVLLITLLSAIAKPWTLNIQYICLILYYIVLSFIVYRHIDVILNVMKTLSVQAFRESTVAPLMEEDETFIPEQILIN